jgi:hypothetical protein
MRMSAARQADPPPADLRDAAAANLRFIRDTLERSASFTAVPGWGGVGMGIVGIAAAAASWKLSGRDWLAVWLAAAALALPIGLVGMIHKARRAGLSLLAGPGTRFAIGFAAPCGAGAALTAAAAAAGRFDHLPATWLLLYGAAVVAGGVLSVRPVLVLGAGLMALGALALLFPAVPNAWLGLGFGALQIVAGWMIARRHGG